MAVIVGQGISVSPVADAELSHESTSTVQNKVVTDAIASEYSTSKTYSVGDVCTHDGKLYECIVDIPTAEGWTLAHWKVSNLGDVANDLTRQLSYFDDIPGTVQSVNFGTDGKPSSVVHTKSGVTVRTDSFAWGTGTVTETRTLANGAYITMVTDLTTLVTTISEIQEAS